jgi:translation initiation factor 2 beta subunit (eIF-2beta)/eIF-5
VIICNTCKHKDECKEIMKSYGVEFVGISECKEYEKGGVKNDKH